MTATTLAGASEPAVLARTKRYALFLANETGYRVVSLPTRGSLVLGRSRASDVPIADGRLSRQHLRIHVDGEFLVEDLGSTNGTMLGNRKLVPGERCEVIPGSVISAGATTLVIGEHGPLSSAPDFDEPPTSISDRMGGVLALADRAASSMISVLLLGETGVGKDVLAERIHRASPRASGPFLRLNCAGLSPALLASELFGHEKGAFTGAVSAHPGLLQSACGGTVFLDEVGELPLDIQAKLLLVLERREVLPVGALRARPLDVRFLSATNRDLTKAMASGAFRSDLYFRLNGITIEVPPLRTRVPEIAALARTFAEATAQAARRPAPELSGEALAALRAYAWPGNIRELRAVIDRAVLLCTDGVLREHDLLLEARPPISAAPEIDVMPAGGEGSERQRVIAALATCGGNQSRAARLLGISRNTLIARIEKYGLARPLAPRLP